MEPIVIGRPRIRGWLFTRSLYAFGWLLLAVSVGIRLVSSPWANCGGAPTKMVSFVAWLVAVVTFAAAWPFAFLCMRGFVPALRVGTVVTVLAAAGTYWLLVTHGVGPACAPH